ncbi:immunoglobulin superfamily member 1-like [Pezoporus wallicus]|uniref:immunoglobulin superfamily member 1-like n=1 Tax=Pezoporus wallicus TaxID=35540 RepID=UPI00254D408E|nr:immunoglobulin superfamily member 1-like [Pezoporus wallicus]XP_061297990.1 immunoglobulin superfamily member 1-like [Pezoporus flaviventris]
MVLPVTTVLAFGTWLLAQSEAAAGAPTISIFLKPPGVIPPGGSTTICCSCQRDEGNVVLYKDGKQLRSQELREGRAKFPISNATQKDAGPYSCHYLSGGTVLARSETLEITVKEFSLPRPVLSVMPGLEVAAGAYVTFRCTITHARAGCFLYLEGHNKAPDLIHKDQDDFNLPRVHKGNEGRYSCQCYSGAALMEWSDVSNSLDLVVKDYTWSNVGRLVLGAAVLVLLGLIVAEDRHSLRCISPVGRGGHQAAPCTQSSL